MKRILLGIVLILAVFLTQAQSFRTDIAVLDSVSHIATYYGGSKYIHVKDSTVGGVFYLYQGGLPVDGLTIVSGANSSKWKRMYGSYDRRYLSSVGGFNNFTTTDSSLLIYLQNNLKLATKFNQFVLTNVTYPNIPSIYQAKGGSHNGTFNPSQLLLVRRFDEAANDTLMQMPYGGATTAYTEYRTTNGSTRFRYDNKHIILPNYGFYSDGRFYPGADSVEVRTNGNGQSGSGAVQAMSIGDVWGYNFRVNSTQYAPYPLANNITTFDFMRNDSRGLKRQITGNGVAGYVADWKGYQYADITGATNNDGSYINKVVDFYSLGGKDDTVSSGTTKAKIMQVSKVDSAIGFYSRQKYHAFNEVWNGYGFVQDGAEDYNHMQGRLKIGLGRPDRNNGGIAQNLLVQGSMRSDTAFHLYQKMDSTGRIVFTAKNDATLNGAFLVQVNQTLDSNATATNVAGGVRSYRNWLDVKNIAIPEPTIDARNYYRVGAGRTSTLQNCNWCSLAEYFGYKQVVLGAGSTINASGIEPRIFWARNEINGLSSGSKGKAPSFSMTGFASQFVMGPNVDSVGILYGFKEDGFRGNTANYITAKYGFFDSTIWQSNIGTQYGFYQVDNRIKNRFSGLTEFGSNIIYLSKDSVPSAATNANRQMLTIDTVSGIQYRMDIPTGGGGGGLSGLTTTRIPFTTSSTSIGDADSLLYNTGTKQVSMHNLKLLNASPTRPSLLLDPGGYDYGRSVWQPSMAFNGLDTTGWLVRPGNNLTYISGGALVSSFYIEGGNSTYLQFYGTNRGMISSVSSLVFNANNSHYEFEGLGDWRLSIVGYGTGSSQGKTIIYETDPTLSVTPLGAMGRNGVSGFKLYDSLYRTLTHFDTKARLRIADTTYTGTAGLMVASAGTTNGEDQIVLKDKANLTNFYGMRVQNAYTNNDLHFTYNNAEIAGFTNTGRMFVGLHNPDTYKLSVLGQARLRSTAAAGNDGGVLTLEGTDLSDQGIRAIYNTGSPVTIWENIANFNTGEVRDFIKAGGGYYHTWYSNGAKSMTLSNGGNLSINTTANTYRLDVNGTGNFAGKVNFPVTSTSTASFNVGGVGALPSAPVAGDIAFSSSDTSINIRLGSNWIPFRFSKPAVAGLNTAIGYGTAWNIADTIKTIPNPTFTTATLTAVTRSASTTDSAIYLNASTGVMEYRKLAGGGGGMADPGSNGVMVRTALNTSVARTLTGTTNRISITNGDGVSANPTFDIGSEVVTTNTTQSITAAKTFTTVNPVFSGVYPTISGGSAGIRVLDQADGREFKWEVNNRQFLVTMQQTDFSYRVPFYFDMSAPADAMTLHSTGTFRLNTVGTGTNIASRKLYVNGSVGYNKDSIPASASITNEFITILDTTTGQVKRISIANLLADYLSEGSFNPTLTNTTNVASSSVSLTYWTKNLSTYELYGEITIDPTATGDTQVEMTIPAASAISQSYEISGSAVNYDNNQVFRAHANTTNDRIIFRGNCSVDASSHVYSFKVSVKYFAP